MLGQRAIRHLDREKFNILGPIGAGDGISTEDRLGRIGQTNHDELTGTEPEAFRSLDSEAEQLGTVVLHRSDGLGSGALGHFKRRAVGGIDDRGFRIG